MTEKGAPKAEKAGHDKSINFRPSPNFKHMKKYLKYKFEEEGCPGASTSQNPGQGSTVQVDSKPNVALQPPLPPNTPPPDYPPKLVLKKEIMDDGYENTVPKKEEQQEEHEPPNQNVVVGDKLVRKEMCRDFVRGNCRWNPCRKSHEMDLSQLEGVYEFCNDFANRKCTRHNCRFVHATTFEKENFFRTGYLPPYLRPKILDKRDSHVAQQQQQQMHTTPNQPMCMPVYPMVGNTPDFRGSCAQPMMPVKTIPAAMDPGMAYNVFVPPQPPASPSHTCPDYIDYGNIRVVEEAVPKCCMNCKISEMRYQENLMEFEKIVDSTQSIKEQIALLDQRKTKLLAVLTKVLWKDIPK